MPKNNNYYYSNIGVKHCVKEGASSKAWLDSYTPLLSISSLKETIRDYKKRPNLCRRKDIDSNIVKKSKMYYRVEGDVTHWIHVSYRLSKLT